MTYANSDQRIFFVYINVDTVTFKARNINREKWTFHNDKMAIQ